MYYKIRVTSLVLGIILVGVLPARAQTAFSRFLDRFDTNKDGKISRSEVPDGLLRRVYDRMVSQYKLDAEKTYTTDELKQGMGIPATSGSSQSSTTSASLGSGSDDRRRSRRSSFGRSSFSRSRNANRGGRRFRSLVELPGQYRGYDDDGDGQVGLYEWPRERIPDFLRLDKNNDGFLTIKELRKSQPSTKNDEAPARKEQPEREMESDSDDR